MELEDAEHFVQAAEEDYRQRAEVYRMVTWYTEENPSAVGDLREARADVLAAHAVLLLACDERRLAQRRAGERAALERLPIGESGQWLERGDEEGRS